MIMFHVDLQGCNEKALILIQQLPPIYSKRSWIWPFSTLRICQDAKHVDRKQDGHTFHDMERGHFWNRTSHFIQHLWNYRYWLVVHQLQSRSFQMDLNGYLGLGDLCSISVCMVFDGFLEQIFSNSRGETFGISPTSPNPKMILNLDPKPMWHSLTTRHGRFWESFGETCFWKEAKRHFKIHGGGLGKVIWYVMIFHWYVMIFQDIVPWQFCWNSWMFDDILLLYICLKLLDVLLVTLSWNLSTVPSGVSPGALETSKQHRTKRKYSAWCRHLHIYI